MTREASTHLPCNWRERASVEIGPREERGRSRGGEEGEGERVKEEAEGREREGGRRMAESLIPGIRCVSTGHRLARA
eukprot:3851692-Rhodomonas_salina.2